MNAYLLLKLALLGGAAAAAVAVAVSLLFFRRMTAFAWIFLAPVLIGAAIYIDAVFIEPNWIAVEHVRLPEKAGLREFEGLTVVHLTDIHLTEGLGFRERELIKKVNRQRPDIVVFTGDLIDNRAQAGPAIELFQSIKARFGVYAIPGDTDHLVMNSPELASRLAPAGINWLLNETRKLVLPGGREIWIAGVDDSNPSPALLQKLRRTAPPDASILLLAPNPDVIAKAAAAGFPLVLTGETHGGQVGIDFLVRMSDYANRTPYMRGLFEVNGTHMYVNRGIGMKTLYIRFLCRPEVAVFKF